MIATSQSDYNLLNARSHIRRRVHATILTDEIPIKDTLTLTLTPDPLPKPLALHDAPISYSLAIA